MNDFSRHRNGPNCAVLEEEFEFSCSVPDCPNGDHSDNLAHCEICAARLCGEHLLSPANAPAEAYCGACMRCRCGSAATFLCEDCGRPICDIHTATVNNDCGTAEHPEEREDHWCFDCLIENGSLEEVIRQTVREYCLENPKLTPRISHGYVRHAALGAA